MAGVVHHSHVVSPFALSLLFAAVIGRARRNVEALRAIPTEHDQGGLNLSSANGTLDMDSLGLGAASFIDQVKPVPVGNAKRSKDSERRGSRSSRGDSSRRAGSNRGKKRGSGSRGRGRGRGKGRGKGSSSGEPNSSGKFVAPSKPKPKLKPKGKSLNAGTAASASLPGKPKLGARPKTKGKPRAKTLPNRTPPGDAVNLPLQLAQSLEDDVANAGEDGKKMYYCPDRSTFTMGLVEPDSDGDAYPSWIFDIFSPPENKGRRGNSKRTKYNVKGVWRVSGEADNKRFRGSSKAAYDSFVESVDAPEEQIVAALKERVQSLQSNIQRTPSYPADQAHPYIPKMIGGVTHFLYTLPLDSMRRAFCNGVWPAHDKGKFGRGIPLVGEAFEVDKFAEADCIDLDDNGECSFMLDNMASTTSPGFPNAEQMDRSKPVHYAIVLLVAPFRVAQDLPIRKQGARGRNSEKQMIWNEDTEEWENFLYDFPSKSFKSPAGYPIKQEYQFLHGLSSKWHYEFNKEVTASNKGFRAILRTQDEYHIFEGNYTRIEYVVAYQRE